MTSSVRNIESLVAHSIRPGLNHCVCVCACVCVCVCVWVYCMKTTEMLHHHGTSLSV